VAAVGGVLLAVLMTWPLAARLGSHIAHDLVDPLFQTWQVAWVGHALAHQPLHLFQANIFWPLADSLAFSDALVGYAPAAVLAQQGPGSALVVYNVLFVFAYALAFLGAYLLARELGAGQLGCVAAGAAFAYAPWRLAQNGHLQVISSGGVPLALFLLVRGYRRGSGRLVIAGWLVAAWQMTLGFTLGLQLAYLLGVLALGGAFVWWTRSPRPSPSRAVVAATLFGVLVFGLAAGSQARPYLRVAEHHPEAERTADHVAGFSPRPASFLAAPPESTIWGNVTAGIRDGHELQSEQTLFPGVIVTLLALAGLFSPVYPRRLRVGLGAGVALCAILSLGLRDVSGPRKYLTPYRLLYELAPGWDGVRTPGRLNTLTSLGLALLAAAGLCLVLRSLGRRTTGWSPRRRLTLQAAVAGLLVAAILAEGAGPIPQPRVPAPPQALDRAAAPVLHMPMDFFNGSRYAYWSTDGFPPVVNGNGAFEPSTLEQLRTSVETFPDRSSLAALRAAGVRTVVLHPQLASGSPWQDAEHRPITGLPLTRTVEDDVVVYRLES